MQRKLCVFLPVLFTAVLSVAGCGSDANSTPAVAAASRDVGDISGSSVNVYNWSDYIAEDTASNFQTRSNLRVNYDVYTNNETLVQKLAASPDAYDLVFPSARPFAHTMVGKGQLLTLDKRKLPNLRHLDPGILAELAAIDPGNQYLVPYMWGTTGIGINVGKVRAALGANAALDTWGLIFDPATASRLSACGIGILDDNLETTSALRLWRGRNVNDHSVEIDDANKRALMTLRPHIRKITGSSELINDLASGDLCLVLSFSGDVLQAKALAEQNAKGVEIRYVIPREGAVRWIDVMAIPKQASNVDNAHRFIDYLLEPKVIADITNVVNYANANAASIPLIDATVSGDPGIYPPQTVRAKLQGISTLSASDAARGSQTWHAFVFGEI
jgi:putrescine transport system substrate-binding protein